MIRLEKLRELALRTAPAPGRPRHLSAASGLVRVEDRLYVIADDEHQLGVFSAEGSEPGTLLTVLPGRLPDGALERKAAKADLEALTRLPGMMEFPHGALFALGSGSRPNREVGALIELDAWGLAGEPAIQVNLHRLYSALRTHLPALNVEGAFTTAEHFCLLHRGNKRDATNACISLPLRTALDALAEGRPIMATPPLDIRPFDLGAIRGVPLCFTDGAALPDGRFVFTAVAEDTEDSYEDGARALQRLKPTKKDVVIGVSASGMTPYVRGGLTRARKAGSKIIFVTCDPRTELQTFVDLIIAPAVGPEVIAGSTRLKAGTATKMVLNMLTTTAMIRIGKTYGNLMVDVRTGSEKLKDRARRIVERAGGSHGDARRRRDALVGSGAPVVVVVDVVDVVVVVSGGTGTVLGSGSGDCTGGFFLRIDRLEESEA